VKKSEPLILIVEDEAPLQRVERLVLAQAGLRVAIAESEAAAFSLLAQQVPDLILLDIKPPHDIGLSMLQGIREITRAPLVAMTATRERATLVACLQAGAHDIVLKPFDPDHLEASVKFALGQGQHYVSESNASLLLGALPSEQLARLSFTEWRLIEILAAQPGQPVLYQEINRRLWGRELRDEIELIRIWAERLQPKIPLVDFHGVGYALGASSR
jgi:DNA-binding response OmpR family regulator